MSGGISSFDVEARATTSSIAILSNSAAQSLFSPLNKISRRTTSHLAGQAWRRAIQSSSRNQENKRAGKDNTYTENGQNPRALSEKKASAAPNQNSDSNPSQTTSPGKYLHLPHMPKLPHRPTKEELLAAATGFWSRLKVRFKWFSIRSVRPWNVDDWSAFVSWFVLGNIVWILVGTTTFFSLIIFSINTVVAQGKPLLLMSRRLPLTKIRNPSKMGR